MMHAITKNDVLRLLYSELSVEKSNEVMSVVETDERFQACFDELAEAKASLPKATFLPSNTSLQRILNYSKETAPETTL